MVTMFIDTLPSLYYDRVVGNVASNFADLVVVGERIEVGIPRGKFTQTNSGTSFSKKLTPEKKKGETNVVLIEPIFPQIKANTSSYPTQAGPRGYYQHQVSTTSREKPTLGIDPNPHDLYQAFSPTTGTKTDRGGPPKAA
ncbi:hypothetical protein CR513_16084, partial [Mucuna pruriens]